ncbi:hypothetical protein Cob_v003619 [Colletotrichum orbiculare MAFF 240422]|uniref:SWIM-type domain-containing protein n=1 Tax=Colletotrichum orbiculare (strain 104-T / ATCC 96160 / CBS 514.97 / LARS 414 / MAFF 240422) TaxID=1213857 RepID=A0A484FZQ2_COLOR|nr:hypothetical protein Cob_v003619 [Colletotrichum orbiculare MAFF 240422]
MIPQGTSYTLILLPSSILSKFAAEISRIMCELATYYPYTFSLCSAGFGCFDRPIRATARKPSYFVPQALQCTATSHKVPGYTVTSQATATCACCYILSQRVVCKHLLAFYVRPLAQVERSMHHAYQRNKSQPGTRRPTEEGSTHTAWPLSWFKRFYRPNSDKHSACQKCIQY